jgi:hypothetical protein
MILNALTIFHVVLSMIGIGSGLVAVYRLLKDKRSGRWTHVFLAATAATNITGFLFPFHGLTPAQVLGVLSLIALIIAGLSMYRHCLQGVWHRAFAITAVMALYFNVFVLIVQLFRRVPALSAIAPTQSERPFQMAQFSVLLLFTAVGIRAATLKSHRGLVPIHDTNKEPL